MLRGIYTAASGMLVQGINTEVISNNLANVDTVGYHRQAANVRAFPAMLISRIQGNSQTPIGTMGTGAVVDGSKSSFLPGRLHQTNNPLDVALVGPGFLVVETFDGPRYTRNGSLSLNQTGWLTTFDGHRIRGENGPIFVGDGAVKIDSQGNVSVNGVWRDRLLIVEFPDRDGLRKVGDSLYEALPEAGSPFRYNAVVNQGTLEMANVNVIREMVGLIDVHRAYEANQKVIQAYDETLGKAVNEIAGK